MSWCVLLIVLIGCCVILIRHVGTYVIQRNWTATDTCTGASVSVTQIINVFDNLPPTLTVPKNVTILCGQSTAPENTGFATANDTCDPNPVVTFTDNESVGDCERNITRTWTASGAKVHWCEFDLFLIFSTLSWTQTDHCNNSVSAVQLIIVTSRGSPSSITPPANITVSCNSSVDPSVTGFANATNSCGLPFNVSFVDTITNGTCPQSYIIFRDCTSLYRISDFVMYVAL